MQIEEIIIVEGIHDVAFLKTFLEPPLFITTDGTSFKKETFDLIKMYKDEGKKFIILTDPDYPGSVIRNKLLEIIPDAKVGFVDKEHARTTKKVGVEHASKEEVLKALDNLITLTNITKKFDNIDLYNLELVGHINSSIYRDKVSKFYKIGECNGKQLLARLNALSKSKEEILKDIKELLNDR